MERRSGLKEKLFGARVSTMPTQVKTSRHWQDLDPEQREQFMGAAILLLEDLYPAQFAEFLARVAPDADHSSSAQAARHDLLQRMRGGAAS